MNTPSQEPSPRVGAQFMLAHPAHLLALGFGSGLSPKAPGTVGTAWAWLAFLALEPWMNDQRWAVLLALALLVGWWACSVTARNMQRPDPGQVVWDEVIAFWLILWLLMPASLPEQAVAFVLFRLLDALKPGPIGWADQLFHKKEFMSGLSQWPRAGLGILLDDLVAAGCTLLIMALWKISWP